MKDFKNNLIKKGTKIKDALIQLNELAEDAILFVIDDDSKLIGSLTDGDIRRGLIKGINIEDIIDIVLQKSPRYVMKGRLDIKELISYREDNYKIIPIVDYKYKVISIINFREVKSYLPIDVVIMAGGRGQRLMPLTENCPKPLLKVGSTPIIEHNINRIKFFGIENFWISINYLGNLIVDYFEDGTKKNININYIKEELPLGTIGSISLVDNFQNDYILVTNSDILTNIDYEKFFLEFINENADVAVVTIPYKVNIPYAVLETKNNLINKLVEKPTYTYYSNGGIYLFKRATLDQIPPNKFYNATDLIENLISYGKKVFSYPLNEYWLDVGSHEDFAKAQIDISNIEF
jgi:dTDP-glucose pyrophosphorylase